MQVLVLNASLKHGNELSNTEEVTNMVLDEMRKYGRVDAEAVRLADKRIPVGLGFREGDDDECRDKSGHSTYGQEGQSADHGEHHRRHQHLGTAHPPQSPGKHPHHREVPNHAK